MLRQVALDAAASCPLGAPGGVLWVREPWMPALPSGFLYGGTDPAPPGGSWLAARDMPREASRIRLRIVALRLERLRDVPDADLELEGALWRGSPDVAGVPDRDGFARWWNSLHARPGTRWEDDPLVWAVTFEVVEPELPPRPSVTSAREDGDST